MQISYVISRKPPTQQVYTYNMGGLQKSVRIVWIIYVHVQQHFNIINGKNFTSCFEIITGLIVNCP